MTRLLAITSLTLTPLVAAPVDYNRDIQPILSENCYHCHGPDAKARKAKLRLNVKDGETGAYRTDSDITVIKPGSSKESELIARIFNEDEDDLMPPPESKRKLTQAQKELLKRWIDEGAKWGEHWAFVPPKRPEVPIVEARNSKLEIRNQIDSFIYKRLADEKLAPQPEAPKEKLLRRVTLDLTGLPPTLEELDAFLADTRLDAYERAVDRLLASPRFGERMVWEWLDAARYADTNGYQGDPTRAMWYWRDWAIEALNKNMPFDQFSIEQIAGDLLENPTQAQLIATGFHRGHMINGEGGRIAEESRVEYVFDRLETTGTVWLGLTMNCCRCHDHKYDPLTQKEYYSLGAFWNSVDETGGGGNDGQGFANPTISLATPEQQKKVDELKAVEAGVQKERDELEKKLRAEQPEWEKAMQAGTGKPPEPTWHALKPDEIYADNGTKLTVLDDGSVLASGPQPEKESYVVVANSKLGALTGFKLEMLSHDSLPGKGPGRAPENGNFVLTEISLQGSGKPVELGAVSVDFFQNETHKAPTVFDGDQNTGWAVMPQFGKAHTLIFEARGQVGYGNDVLLSFRLDCKSGHKAHTLGRFKLYATTDSPALLRPTPDNIRAILAKPADQRSDAEKNDLTKHFLDTSPKLAGVKQRRDDAKKRREDAEKSAPRTMVMRERKEPRKNTVLIKGAYNAPGDEVQHGIPARVGKLPDGAPKNRLTLARWLVSPENPLSARVTVNRLWQQFFGIGIVKTPEDFGVQGDKPTHPELLEWLAVEFRESGWDVKKLVRLMVTSAAYRQSSALGGQSSVPSAQSSVPGARLDARLSTENLALNTLHERDPDNKLLARGPRYRWPSWMLRDQALAVSGLLVEKLGGPPAKGYQPEGVWEDATFGQIKYKQDKGEALYRRSLYTFWRRIIAPTMFFDASSRQNCSIKTARTNTALHALVTMNDVQWVEASRALAQRTLQSPTTKDDASRIAEMFRRCTSRFPKPDEVEIFAKRLAALRTTYGQDEAAAKKLIAVGESKPDPGISPPELAAWSGIALMMLNLDETLSKE